MVFALGSPSPALAVDEVSILEIYCGVELNVLWIVGCSLIVQQLMLIEPQETSPICVKTSALLSAASHKTFTFKYETKYETCCIKITK